MINEYADYMKKILFSHIKIFIITAVACLAFMLLVTLIPQGAIGDNAKQSASYFQETPLFEKTAGSLENFKRDNYADCITTGIAYHLGNGNGYEAVIRADFNHVTGENVNVSFYREMAGEAVETESYSRYWHGTAGVVRLFLTLMDIQTLRYVIAVVGIVLNAALAISLMRKRKTALGVIYIIAFALVNGFFALGCLEYGMIFILLPIASLVLLQLKTRENAQLTFLVIGMLTAFFDFLTAETLTFTIPFAIYYIAVCRNNAEPEKQTHRKQKRSAWMLLGKTGVSWCVGYVGMFLLKWILAVLSIGKSSLQTTFESVAERIGGDVNVVTDSAKVAGLGERIQGILVRNLGCLYWGDNDMKVSTVVLISVIVVIVISVFWYMARKPKLHKDGLGVLMVAGLIPYVRFLLLSNHSYIHYFFTYRAQMITVLVILYILYDTTVISERKGAQK